MNRISISVSQPDPAHRESGDYQTIDTPAYQTTDDFTTLRATEYQTTDGGNPPGYQTTDLFSQTARRADAGDLAPLAD